MKDEDSQMLQNDLYKLYIWADEKNLTVSESSNIMQRCGIRQEIKTTTTNKSYDDTNIVGKEQVKDLAIMDKWESMLLYRNNHRYNYFSICQCLTNGFVII